MKGLDLCRAYFAEVLQPILATSVPEIGQSYAAALIGWGSDVLGHDDEISRDHEWGPRCYLFLPNALQEHTEKIHRKLNSQAPMHFRGFPTRFAIDPGNPTVRVPTEESSGRVHVEITTCDLYLAANLGAATPANDLEWLTIPENRLLELTRGEVFFDGAGELTRIRGFYEYYPVDVWKYRLAYAWQALGWDIDIVRLCADRGDTLSARYSLAKTLSGIMELTFLLNKRYSPFSKWLHREFYGLPHLSREIGPILKRCYAQEGLTVVPDLLSKAIKLLIQHQDQIGELPRMKMRPRKSARPYPDFDSQYVADRIRGTIKGELREIPLLGAVDQWVGNYDLLLDAAMLKPLSSVYDTPLDIDKFSALIRFADED